MVTAGGPSTLLLGGSVACAAVATVVAGAACLLQPGGGPAWTAAAVVAAQAGPAGRNHRGVFTWAEAPGPGRSLPCFLVRVSEQIPAVSRGRCSSRYQRPALFCAAQRSPSVRLSCVICACLF